VSAPVEPPRVSEQRTRGQELRPEDAAGAPDKRPLLRRLVEYVLPGPDSKQELMETLAEAEDNQVIAAESRAMLEGVLRMSELTASHVMVAAPRMDMLDIDAPYDDLLATVIDTAHSRFPVYEGHKENIIGILMAKDLLKLQRAPELNLRALLRPAIFIPENKVLNDLLREFRNNRNHLAVVVDEFGKIAGLVTIEDVLEQIVGEIEDEFDLGEDEGDVFGLADRTYRVSGQTTPDRFNEAFDTHLPTSEFDTLGGWVARQMGHVPRKGEKFMLHPWQLTVLHTRAGAVIWFKVEPSTLGK
jgi:magnesium and cobalt transporter